MSTSSQVLPPLLFKLEADAAKIRLLDFRLRALLEIVRLAASPGAITVTDVDSIGVHMSGGPHYDRRAIDLRVAPFSEAQALALCSWLNATFYNLGRPVALFGAIDPRSQHDDHIHLQVPRPYTGAGLIDLTVTKGV